MSDKTTVDLDEVSKENFNLVKGQGPYRFISANTLEGLNLSCDICGRHGPNIQFENKSNVVVTICLGGALCYPAACDEKEWCDILFNISKRSFSEVSAEDIDNETNKLMKEVQKYVKAGLASPIVENISQFYAAKGFVSPKQLNVIKKFMDARR